MAHTKQNRAVTQDSRVKAGDRVLVGQTLVTVDAAFAGQLQPGDSILGISATGALRRIPHNVNELVHDGVTKAVSAFNQLGSVSENSLDLFFDTAAKLLEDDAVFTVLASANDADVEIAQAKGKSVTRLRLSTNMRTDMIAAFRMWRDLSISQSEKISEQKHVGWTVEEWRSPLGVIGFVFEGRPNVFADATGVLRTGNSVVFRIGSDALGTAKAIMKHVISPALDVSGLPDDAVVLIDSPEHAAGWALFSDNRLALAVARGSGEAVSELGSIAQQTGVAVSLHGTGGAWIIAGEEANSDDLQHFVEHSLDRKVCNTVNVVCVPQSRAGDLFDAVVRGAEKAAAKRNTHARVHCVNGSEKNVVGLESIEVIRSTGISKEPQISVSSLEDLKHEFEWEETPEFFLVQVESLEQAVQFFNDYSPQFVVSAVSNNSDEVSYVWNRTNSPFFGDGFTRWVDGQFALLRPELGLSNWERGRLFARSGILSGDSAYTIRLRVRQENKDLHR